MEAPDKQFKIYKSSAGSGKTFTLVKEYLGIVLRNPNQYRSVLAITFTNKAAGEMKERILGELQNLAEKRDSPMLAALVDEFGLDATTIPSNAREVLSYILHDYANFGVSTIDSFTYRLIRNFARDLDLPSKFDVETDNEALLERMIDQLMDTIGRDEYVTEILVRYVEEKLREEAGWKIDRSIQAVGKELFKENSKVPIQSLQELEEDKFVSFIGFIAEEKERYPERINALAEQAIEMIEAAGLGHDDFKGGYSSGVLRKLEIMAGKQQPTDFQRAIESRNFASAATEDEWTRKDGMTATLQSVINEGLGGPGRRDLGLPSRPFPDLPHGLARLSEHPFAGRPQTDRGFAGELQKPKQPRPHQRFSAAHLGIHST